MSILNESADNRETITAYFKFDEYYFNLIPLLLSDRLFLSVSDDNFNLNGYRIYRLRDMVKVNRKTDFYYKMLKNEGVTENIMVPLVNINSWKDVFSSLQALGMIIIVEKQSLNMEEYRFIIGRVENVYSQFVYVRDFDADGEWMDNLTRIPYSEITNITFGDRYSKTYSKYVTEPPAEILKSKKTAEWI